MTLDEAIKHAREVAEDNIQKSRQMTRDPFCVVNLDKTEACNKCAKEHEQLVDWLEELKAYRERNITNELTDKTLREQLVEEFKSILKQMYLNVANNVNGNDYTSKNDLVSIVCSKCRIEALRLLENMENSNG